MKSNAPVSCWPVPGRFPFGAVCASIVRPSVQPDFVLSEVRPNGEQKIIPDDKVVDLRDGDEFWAIPGDDNS